MPVTSVEAWCRSAECSPADGDVVLAFFPDDVLGPEFWIVLEYHRVPAKFEANRHMWHGPGNPLDDYCTPEYWQPLTKPAAAAQERAA